MIEHVAILSLQITAIHIVMQSGNMLSWLRVALANLLDKLHRPLVKIYVMKPISDCLPCMASFWTIVLTWSLDPKLILAVCGLNFIIDNMFLNESDPE